MTVKIPVKMIIKTSITALNHVVTYGKDSCENLVNTIKNLEAVLELIDKNEEDSKDDSENQQGEGISD